MQTAARRVRRRRLLGPMLGPDFSSKVMPRLFRKGKRSRAILPCPMSLWYRRSFTGLYFSPFSYVGSVKSCCFLVQLCSVKWDFGVITFPVACLTWMFGGGSVLTGTGKPDTKNTGNQPINIEWPRGRTVLLVVHERNHHEGFSKSLVQLIYRGRAGHTHYCRQRWNR